MRSFQKNNILHKKYLKSLMAMKFSYLLEFMTISIVVSMPDGT